jgi:hypothetical protein
MSTSIPGGGRWSASGGGDDSKSEEQPRAKQIAHALEPARNPAPKDRSRLETLLRVGRRVHSSPSTILTSPSYRAARRRTPTLRLWIPAKQRRAALPERKHWLMPEWLAKYAPDLNDIERDWETLKAIISPTK